MISKSGYTKNPFDLPLWFLQSDNHNNDYTPTQQQKDYLLEGYQSVQLFELGKHLKDNDVTQSQLARELGATKQCVNFWLKSGVPERRKKQILDTLKASTKKRGGK